MSKVKLTAGRIESFECEAARSQSFLWDTESPGLGLRATAGNAKAYIFQGKLKGQTIRITIGDPKTWSIEGARQEARRLKVIIDNGQDPRLVKADGLAAEQAAREARANEAAEADKAARRASITLAEAWPEYLKYGDGKRNKRTGEIGWSAAHKRAHAEMAAPGGERKKRGSAETKAGPLAPLMPCRLCELTAERLTSWLNQETQTRPTAAALSFRLLRAFAGWANDTIEYSGIIPADAFVTRKVRDALPKSEAKDGDCLQREQLSAWFEQVKKVGNPVISAYLQGLLLTGARRRELSALKWTDVDFQWRSLTIRDKVEGTRVIPLTPYLAFLLQSLPRRNEWVFSSPASKDGKITEPRYAHTDALKAAGLPHVSLHGLRRSFGTLAEWLETPAGITAQIMGHSESALAEKHYRRRPLDLLRMWHDKIEAWILNEAGITYVPDQPRLKAVTAA